MINFNDATVLITGGSGTFGSAMARFILANQAPRKLILFSRGEHRQAEVARQLAPLDRQAGGVLRFFLGDVTDLDRLVEAMRGVDYVIHAAAIKSIDACEYNPQEAIRVNVTGSLNVARAAGTLGVRKVLAVSTDKACSPTTLYGATKLVMERTISAANSIAVKTAFSAVRYGNVLGSTGSVLPLYRKLLAEQRGLRPKTLPLTHVDMTRFFWTANDALRFSLYAMEVAAPGEVLLPRLKSAKITDLALALHPNCEFRITGIRPGEKLSETMLAPDEEPSAVDYGDAIGIQSPSMAAAGVATEALLGIDYNSSNESYLLDIDGIREMIRRHDNELIGQADEPA